MKPIGEQQYDRISFLQARVADTATTTSNSTLSDQIRDFFTLELDGDSFFVELAQEMGQRNKLSDRVLYKHYCTVSTTI